jgi:hypothetical protein
MKLFRLEEANKLIPSAREILASIKSNYAEVSAVKENARKAAKAAESGGGGMAGGSNYVQNLYELGKLTSELEAIGIQLKDYEKGLIDFPAMRDGKIVLLCWQLDEGDEILWWHDLESGFGGRQPIDF